MQNVVAINIKVGFPTQNSSCQGNQVPHATKSLNGTKGIPDGPSGPNCFGQTTPTGCGGGQCSTEKGELAVQQAVGLAQQATGVAQSMGNGFQSVISQVTGQMQQQGLTTQQVAAKISDTEKQIKQPTFRSPASCCSCSQSPLTQFESPGCRQKFQIQGSRKCRWCLWEGCT